LGFERASPTVIARAKPFTTATRQNNSEQSRPCILGETFYNLLLDRVTVSDTAKRSSKIMDLVMYLALKSTQQATFSELYREFVQKRGWSKNTLTKYLSLLHQRGVITRSWLKYVDTNGKEKRFRVYRLNPEYPKQG